MKEREGNPNQSELTQKPIQSTLESGDIFMPNGPDNGEGAPRTEDSINPQDRVREGGVHPNVGRRVGRRSQLVPPINADEIPDWAANLVNGWTEAHGDRQTIMDRAVNQFVAEEFRTRVGPQELTVAQKQALNIIGGMLLEDPKGCAKSFTRAIDALDLPTAEPIAQTWIISSVNKLLEIVDLPDKSKEKFRDQARELLEKTAPNAARGLEVLIENIGEEPKNLEKNAARRARNAARKRGEPVLPRGAAVVPEVQAVAIEEPAPEPEVAATTETPLPSVVPDVSAAEVEPEVLVVPEAPVVAPEPEPLPAGEPLTEALADGVGAGDGRVPPTDTAVAAPEPEEPEEVVPVAPVVPEVVEAVEPVVSEPEAAGAAPESPDAASAADSTTPRVEPHPAANSPVTPEDEWATRRAREVLAQQKLKRILDDINNRMSNGEITEDQAEAEVAEFFGGTADDLRDRELKRLTENPDRRDDMQLMNEAFEKIASAANADEALMQLRQLIGQIDVIQESIGTGGLTLPSGSDGARMDAWRVKAKEVFESYVDGRFNGDLAAIQDAARELKELGHAPMWQFYKREGKEVRNITQPESLEDLIKLIVSSEIREWRVGGDKELITTEGEVQMHHFLEWVRDKIMYNHEFNPDGEIHLFQEIYIPTPYRQIGLGEIINNPRYFRKHDKKQGYVSDEKRDALKNQILYEVWLFENNHNFEAKYRQSMGNEEKAVEALLGIHALNIFTKNKDRLYNILTLTSTDKDQVDGLLESGDRGRASVGQAIRRSLVAYNYLYEIGYDPNTEGQSLGNMFEMVLDQDNPEGTLDFYRAIIGKILKDRFGSDLKAQIKTVEDSNKPKEMQDSDHIIDALITGDFANLEAILTRDVDPNDPTLNTYLINALKAYRNVDAGLLRRIVGGGEVPIEIKDSHRGLKTTDLNIRAAALKEFTRLLMYKTNIQVIEDSQSSKATLEDLNIFSAFGKQPYIQSLLREGIKTVVGRKEQLSERNARYAEAWAFPMVYWTGISARCDTKAQGFDGLSKLINFKDYRAKQANGRGRFGDEETIYGGIDKMAMTMWEALRVVDEKTGVERPLLELIQGGWGSNANLGSPIEAFNFAEGSQQLTLAAQHYSNGLSGYKLLMDEHGINYDSFLGRDSRGRLIVTDLKKADEFRSRIVKFWRYAFDMGGYYYDRRTRGWVQDSKLKHSARVQELGEFMFGKTLRGMGMYDKDEISKLSGKEIFGGAYRPRTNENGQYLRRDGSITDKAEEAEPVLKNMSRNGVAWLTAMDMLKHRKFSSKYTRYGISDILAIHDFLTVLPVEIEQGKNPGEVTIHRAYYNEKEWRRIAKLGHATIREITVEELKFAAVGGGGAGLFEAVKAIAAYTIK